MEDDFAPETWPFKVVVIGNSNVGKSSLLRRFHFGLFDAVSTATVGAEVVLHHMSVDEQPVKLELWDTAGQERFRSMVQGYYRNADAAILVFDRTRPESFESLFTFWLQEIKDRCPQDAVAVVVCNKADLEASVDMIAIQQRCELHGLALVETSCKEGGGVEKVFSLLARELVMRRRQDASLVMSMQASDLEANMNSIMLHHQHENSSDPSSGYCCSYF